MSDSLVSVLTVLVAGDFCVAGDTDFEGAVIADKDFAIVVFRGVGLVFGTKKAREKIGSVFDYGVNIRVTTRNFVIRDVSTAEEISERKPTAILFDLGTSGEGIARAGLLKVAEETRSNFKTDFRELPIFEMGFRVSAFGVRIGVRIFRSRKAEEIGIEVICSLGTKKIILFTKKDPTNGEQKTARAGDFRAGIDIFGVIFLTTKMGEISVIRNEVTEVFGGNASTNRDLVKVIEKGTQ